jgi:hypothetical protein
MDGTVRWWCEVGNVGSSDGLELRKWSLPVRDSGFGFQKKIRGVAVDMEIHVTGMVLEYCIWMCWAVIQELKDGLGGGFVIPCESEAAVEYTNPIGRDGVQGRESGDKMMLSMFFANIAALHQEVVNNQQETEDGRVLCGVKRPGVDGAGK